MDEQKPLNPWEPYRLLSYFMFITIFGSGILLGINWKRLGKPEWMWKTILLSIFLPAAMIAGPMVFVLNAIETGLPEWLALLGILLPISINFAYLWSLTWLQNGAFQKFKAEGAAVLPGYVYDFQKAIVYGVLGAIGITVAVTVFISFLNG
ncbi:hypothetical protein ANAEL_00156 [Anaerolineales bacterium]|nr:hypothetical protein ANAEL_00156 [Anaerolineales bacterium]